VELLVVIAIIATLAALSYGPVLKQVDAARRINAISDARSLTSSLLFFYTAHNRQFPNNATDRNGNTIVNAHQAFQQLFDNKTVDDEEYFWNVTNGRVLGNLNEPLNDLILNQNENVWNYIMNLDASFGNIPLIFDSIDTGTMFTAETWDGSAIVGYVDGSVLAEQIIFTGPPKSAPNVYATGPVHRDGNDILDPAFLPNGAVFIPR